MPTTPTKGVARTLPFDNSLSPAPNPTKVESSSDNDVDPLSDLLSLITSWQQQSPASNEPLVHPLSRSLFHSFSQWFSEHERRPYKFYFDEDTLELTLILRSEYESVTGYVLDKIVNKL